MSFTINGQIVAKYDTVVVSEKFRKREFAIEIKDGGNYTQYAKFQLTQTKCEILDGFNIGDDIKVSFDIRGTKYDKNGVTTYFSNLDAWRIEKLTGEDNRVNTQQNQTAPAVPNFQEAPASFDNNAPFADDLPF